MWLVAVDNERVSAVPACEGVVGIAVPVVAVACALDAPGAGAFIVGKDELLGGVAACDKRTAQQLRDIYAVVVHHGETVAVALEVPYKARVGFAYAVGGGYAVTYLGNA